MNEHFQWHFVVLAAEFTNSNSKWQIICTKKSHERIPLREYVIQINLLLYKQCHSDATIENFSLKSMLLSTECLVHFDILRSEYQKRCRCQCVCVLCVVAVSESKLNVS